MENEFSRISVSLIAYDHSHYFIMRFRSFLATETTSFREMAECLVYIRKHNLTLASECKLLNRQ